MAFDLLSDVLDLPHVRAGTFGRIVAGGTWAISSHTGNDISFCAVTSGTCYYFFEGMKVPARVEAGDIVVLCYPEWVKWASQPEAVADAGAPHFQADVDGVFTFGTGCDFEMVAGGFLVDADRRDPKQFRLPRAMHIRADAPEAAALIWLVNQLVCEMKQTTLPGRKTVLGALAQLLFAHSMRAYLAVTPAAEAGWLSVFSNGRLMAALASLHGDPAHGWTVDALAKRAGMSRSSFSDRFRETMGMPPLTYLINWRMRIATEALREGASVANAAAQVGYGSERAFSTAFRRMMAASPGAYRRAALKAKDAQGSQQRTPT